MRCQTQKGRNNQVGRPRIGSGKPEGFLTIPPNWSVIDGQKNHQSKNSGGYHPPMQRASKPVLLDFASNGTKAKELYWTCQVLITLYWTTSENQKKARG